MMVAVHCAGLVISQALAPLTTATATITAGGATLLGPTPLLSLLAGKAVILKKLLLLDLLKSLAKSSQFTVQENLINVKKFK